MFPPVQIGQLTCQEKGIRTQVKVTKDTWNVLHAKSAANNKDGFLLKITANEYKVIEVVRLKLEKTMVYLKIALKIEKNIVLELI